MNDWFSDFLADFGAISAGVFFGFAAKYGLLVGDGIVIRLRNIVGDILLLGVVVIFAVWFIQRVHFGGVDAVAISALFALASDRTVKTIKRWWLNQVETRLQIQAVDARGELRNLVQAAQSAAELAEAAKNQGHLPDFKANEKLTELPSNVSSREREQE